MAEIIGKKTKNEKGGVLYSAAFYEDGYVYKNMDAYDNPENYPPDEIVYIPEKGFPENGGMEEVPTDRVVGYTKQQLIALGGSTIAADAMFDMLTWQFPETLWIELCGDSNGNGHWIEAGKAYEKVYLPEFEKSIDRVGQAPVCYQEFFDNEWQDEACRREYLDELLKIGEVDDETIIGAMKDFAKETEME